MENLKNDGEQLLNQILMVRDEVAQMGANDSEIPIINSIIEKLKRGEMSPEEALSNVYKIKDRKADYH